LKKAELKRKEAVKQQELLINSKQVSITNAQDFIPTCPVLRIRDKHPGSEFFHPVPEFLDPRFHENKPKTKIKKIAFWSCFRENCVYNFGHRILGQKVPDSVPRSASKNLGIFNPKICSKLSEI
jgi:hypothetical protein